MIAYTAADSVTLGLMLSYKRAGRVWHNGKSFVGEAVK